MTTVLVVDDQDLIRAGLVAMRCTHPTSRLPTSGAACETP